MKLQARYLVAVALALLLAASAPAADFNPAELSPVSRTEIADGIAHYTYEVTVDTGPYNQIRLHRFVRESQPNQPIPTIAGVLLLPGGFANVLGTFAISLISEGTPWDQSLALFLADNDIDVWGMDYGWALVPVERRDFRFMKDWGVAKDARHAAAALAFARIVRENSGQGTGKLTLLGHSWGMIVGYAVLSEETQRPDEERSVGAFVPMDWALKLSSSYAALRAESCTEAIDYQAMWDSGTYADSLGAYLNYVGWLAESDPEGPSDSFPGLTNYQTFLYNADIPDAPWLWHLLGADFDRDGYPTELRFTDPQLGLDLFQNFSPYFPVRMDIEDATLRCDEVPVPGFEHLGQISVPILYVGAAGGFGEAGYNTLTLTGSSDVSRFTVQRLPDRKRGYDFGHGDVLTARDAEELVWEPILDWILTH